MIIPPEDYFMYFFPFLDRIPPTNVDQRYLKIKHFDTDKGGIYPNCYVKLHPYLIKYSKFRPKTSVNVQIGKGEHGTAMILASEDGEITPDQIILSDTLSSRLRADIGDIVLIDRTIGSQELDLFYKMFKNNKKLINILYS